MLGLAVAAVQSVTPPLMRARANLIYLSANYLAGGMGPVVVGFWVRHSSIDLATALVFVVVAAFVLSGLAFLRLAALVDDGSSAYTALPTGLPVDTDDVTSSNNGGDSEI